MKQKLYSVILAILTMVIFIPQARGAAPTKATVDQYKEMPLTFEMPNSGVTASFCAERVGYSGNNEFKVEYRLSNDGGTTWGAWTTWIDNTKTSISNPSAVTLGGGGSPYKAWKVQLRGTNLDGLNHSSSKYIRIYFSSGASTRTINVYGNIMSLIVGYDTNYETDAKKTLADANEIPCDYCFYGLFCNGTTASTKTSVNLYCENLVFPASKLTDYCYANLFKDNINGSYGLKSGPIFLATDFVDKNGEAVEHSFENLCYGATGLTSIAVNFDVCPESGDNNITNWMYNVSSKTMYAPETFRTCANTNLLGTWTKSEFSYTSTTPHTVTIASNNTDYGTVDASSLSNVPHGAAIAVSSNKITINGTTVTATPATATAAYDYAFVNWTSNSTEVTSSTTVTADMTITANFSQTLKSAITLADNVDNTSLLAIFDNQTVDVTLGRTLYADGAWSTLCLPFNLSISGTALNGAEVRTMTDAYIYDEDGANEKLIIECDESSITTSLAAGKPYIIKLAGSSNVVNPTFNDVTIDVTAAEDNKVEGTDVDFISMMIPTALYSDGSNLILGASNTLYKVAASPDNVVNSFRAYFGYRTTHTVYPKKVMIRFNRETPTDVEEIELDAVENGKRLENGIMVIYHNGVRYDAQGHQLD